MDGGGGGFGRGNEGSELTIDTEGGVAGRTGDVKKVPNARFQGLDRGETTVEDFPFRLKTSRK